MLDLRKGNKATSLHLYATNLQIQLLTLSRAFTEQCMKASLSSSTSMRSKRSDRFKSKKQSTSKTLRSTKQSIELVQEASELMISLLIHIWLTFSNSFLKLCTKMIWLDQATGIMITETTRETIGETIKITDRIMGITIHTEEAITISRILVTILSRRECQEQVGIHTLIQHQVWHQLCHPLLLVAQCSKLLLKWHLLQDTWLSLRDFSHLLPRKIHISKSRQAKPFLSLSRCSLEKRELLKLQVCWLSSQWIKSNSTWIL